MSCNFSAGTLGGFESVKFPVGKARLDKALDCLFEFDSTYIIPDEWKEFDSWHERGYDFLDSRIFYFGDPPKEMYYVTYIGDKKMLSNPNSVEIAIRAVNNGAYHWILRHELSDKEAMRIMNRFDSEIVVKLQKYLAKGCASEHSKYVN